MYAILRARNISCQTKPNRTNPKQSKCKRKPKRKKRRRIKPMNEPSKHAHTNTHAASSQMNKFTWICFANFFHLNISLVICYAEFFARIISASVLVAFKMLYFFFCSYNFCFVFISFYSAGTFLTVVRLFSSITKRSWVHFIARWFFSFYF